MKRLTTVILTFLTCGIVHALPVGNPLDPIIYTNHFCNWSSDCHWYDAFSVRLGFYGDYVFNRKIETEGSSLQTLVINTNAGLVTLNFCEWIEAFGTVGVSNFFVRSPAVTTRNGRTIDIETNDKFTPSMSYSVGGRAILWECNCFYFGVEGQYFYSPTRASLFYDYTVTDSSPGIAYENNDPQNRLDYSEWQAALTASYLFETQELSFIPYIAFQFAKATWKPVLQEYSPMYSSCLNGWTLGSALVLNNLIGVSCEARFANEKALAVMGQLSF